MDVQVGSVSFLAVTNDWLFDEMAQGRWEPHTVRAFRSLVQQGSRVLDIGAWEGPLTLLAAALGARVDAYEPDPVAVEKLQRNLDANPSLRPRVVVHDVAVADRTGTAYLSAKSFGSSGASLVRGVKGLQRIAVTTVDARTIGTDLGPSDLLKIDTEGGEYVIVPRLRRHLSSHRPSLFLSVHLYPFREPFAAWPKLARGPLFRLRGLPKQAVLLWRLRFYPHRYVEVSGAWTPLRRHTLWRTLLSVRTKDLLFVTHPLRLT